MTFDNMRIHALKLAIQHNPSSTLDNLFPTADRILAYLSQTDSKPGPLPDVSEIFLCGKDPIYFAEKLRIPSVQFGAIRFAPYPFQKDVFRLMDREPVLAICSARQMGLTTCLAIYSVWSASKPNQAVVIMCPSFSTAVNFMDKVETFLASLPASLNGLVDVRSKRKGSIELTNGSSIVAMKAGALTTNPNLLIMHDAAYFPHSAVKKLPPAEKIVLQSAPGVKEGIFYDSYMRTDIWSMTLPWYLNPGRDESFKDQMITMLGEEAFAHEFECKFKDGP